jgi:hypothetical protein
MALAFDQSCFIQRLTCFRAEVFKALLWLELVC